MFDAVIFEIIFAMMCATWVIKGILEARRYSNYNSAAAYTTCEASTLGKGISYNMGHQGERRNANCPVCATHSTAATNAQLIRG